MEEISVKKNIAFRVMTPYVFNLTYVEQYVLKN